MPRLRGFELHSRWVPLNNSASFLIVSKVANCRQLQYCFQI